MTSNIHHLPVAATPLQVLQGTDMQTLNSRTLTVSAALAALQAVPEECAHWRIDWSWDKFNEWLGIADVSEMEGEEELAHTTLLITLRERPQRPQDCAILIEFLPAADGNAPHWLNRPDDPEYNSSELVQLLERSYQASRSAAIRRGAREAAAAWDAAHEQSNEED